MAIDLGNPTFLTLVADSGTPEELVQYAGIRLLIPEGITLPPDGVADSLVVLGVTVPGYARTGVGGREWVMTSAQDPIAAALNSIPQYPSGWASASAKSTYANIGGALLGGGFSLPEVTSGLQQLYAAAVTDYLARAEGE
jgi:hypothetical protein